MPKYELLEVERWKFINELNKRHGWTPIWETYKQWVVSYPKCDDEDEWVSVIMKQDAEYLKLSEESI